MHHVDLIRAAAEDVASARILLKERIEALDAIVATALDLDIPADQVADAASAAQPAETEAAPVAARRLFVA
ncbi:hypothetical protein [Paeniglutamicibacter sp.]|uniref:hypothetical protein n=1 Tax=Paeniglutamicibacter sp. TaxID=1934391 RepID=UPI003989BA0F